MSHEHPLSLIIPPRHGLALTAKVVGDMIKHFCDICKQPALDNLKAELTSTHGEISIKAIVHLAFEPRNSIFPAPDLCDKCLATILEDLHKKYTAVG